MACIAFIITSHACTGVGASFFMEHPIKTLTIPEINYIDIKIIDFNVIGRYGSLTTPFAGSGRAVQALCEETSKDNKGKE